VLAPVSIALLMIVGGTLVSTCSATSVRAASWRLSLLGVAIALYTFMADSLRAVQQGVDATKMPLPEAFNWPVFVVALALMAAPVAESLCSLFDAKEFVARYGPREGRNVS
jgi:hypothetical protein